MNINVDINNQYYKSENGVLFNKSGTDLIKYPSARTNTTYLIPSRVTKICYGAFDSASNLRSMNIPNGVKIIENSAFDVCLNLETVTIPSSVEIIGDNVSPPFHVNDKLQSITVDVNNQYYKSENGVLFNKSGTDLIKYPSSKNGTSYTVPNSVTNIRDYAFCRGTKLMHLTIPNNVTNMANFAIMMSGEINDFYPTICGYIGSRAQTYAGTHGIPFIDIVTGETVGNFFNTTINSLAFGTAKRLPVAWNDNYFNNPSSSYYNHDLAKLSILLSNASYSNNGNNQYIRDAFDNLRFKNAVHTNYTLANKDTVAFSFGHKKIISNSKEYELLIIVVRGTPKAIDEWEGNFDVGFGNTHSGFEKAKNNVKTHLANYINSTGFNNNANRKVLITGHSRGAAVANLLAADLTNGDLSIATKDNIYAYTFATPKTIAVNLSSDNHRVQYDNIFNLLHYDDFVPVFPLIEWNYCRYGRTISFPNSLYGNMSKSFENLYARKFKPYNSINSISNFSDDLRDLAPTINNYYFTSKRLENLLATRWITPSFFVTQYLCDALVNGTNSPGAGRVLKDSASRLFGILGKDDFSSVSNFFIWYGGIGDEMEYSHASETYIAWLEALNKDWITKTYPAYQRVIKIACPVDVYIYDESGILVGSVINSEIDNTIRNPVDITLLGTDNDIKEITVSPYQNFSIELVGTDDGTMTYSTSLIDIETEQIISTEVFSDVQLTNGKNILSTISDTTILENGKNLFDVQLLTLYDNNIVYQIAKDGSETPLSNSIHISAKTNVGGMVTGSGMYYVDDNVTLEAIPNIDFEFDGWYENNILISTNLIYSFTAETNRNISAVFISSPVLSNDTSLSTFTIDGVDKLDAGTTIDLGTVPNSKTSMDIVATATSPFARVDGAGVRQLTVGLNTFTVKVIAEDDTEVEYTITITREELSTNNNLATLTVDGVNILTTETTYNLSRPYSATNIELGATVEDTGKATLNQSDLGEKQLTVVGNNQFAIVVIAEDSTTKTYTINITREAPNSDTSLLVFTIDGVDKLDAGTTIDLGTVPNSKTSMDIVATATSPFARVDGAGVRQLVVGLNTFVVKVIAEDNTEVEYTINITREDDDIYIPSGDTSLSEFMIDGVDKLGAGTIIDLGTIPNSKTSIDIVATATCPLARIDGVGIRQLAVGLNTFVVKVIAEDNTEAEYTVTITRQAPSSDTTLSLFTIDGVDKLGAGTTIDLGTVLYSKSNIDIVTTTRSPFARVEGAGIRQLAVGLNTVTIKVVAEDNTEAEYTVTITRQAPSSDTSLSLFTIDGVDKLGAGTTIDLGTVPNSKTSIDVVATATCSFARIDGIGIRQLVVGLNTVIVKVIAEDDTEVSYTITIIREDINGNVYSVLKHFGDFTGSGTVTASINADHTLFSRLLLNNVEVSKDNYTVTEGSTVLTLHENYLKTLSNGTHVFTAEFSDGISTNITLSVLNRGNINNNGNTNAILNSFFGNPQTGDINILLIIITSIFSIVGIIVIRKKLKKKTKF